MNWFLVPTLLLGFIAFALAERWAKEASSIELRSFGWCVVLLVALPGVVYTAYYTKLLGEPLWLYCILRENRSRR